MEMDKLLEIVNFGPNAKIDKTITRKSEGLFIMMADGRNRIKYKKLVWNSICSGGEYSKTYLDLKA